MLGVVFCSFSMFGLYVVVSKISKSVFISCVSTYKKKKPTTNYHFSNDISILKSTFPNAATLFFPLLYIYSV